MTTIKGFDSRKDMNKVANMIFKKVDEDDE